MNNLKCFIFLSIVLLICSCTSPKVTDEEIIGLWKSNDATIEFKENNIVLIEDYPLRLNNSSFEGNLNGQGTWVLKEENKIKISAVNDKIIEGLLSNKIAIDLIISKKGILDDGSVIDYLYIIEGDPDLVKKYKFDKISN